jgi:hypothetical protein
MEYALRPGRLRVHCQRHRHDSQAFPTGVRQPSGSQHCLQPPGWADGQVRGCCRTLLAHRRLSRSRRQRVWGCAGSQYCGHTLQERRLVDRLAQTRTNARRLRQLSVSTLRQRSEHDQRDSGQERVSVDRLGECKPIHAWHVQSDDGQVIRYPALVRSPELFHGLWTAFYTGAVHSPASNLLLQDGATGRIVVHNKDSPAREMGWRRWGSLYARRRFGQAYCEPEGAPLAWPTL